ncbi:MAG: hypothetical protein WAX44_01335 [Minisyncoccia bacterium]
MEPKFQTSFIPKKPVIDASRATLPTVKNVNIFSTIATVVFVLTILVSGGLFGYRYYLIGKIVQNDKDLNSARAAFQPETIKQLLDASTRFTTISNLLENHFVVSELLVMLEQLTVKNVAFSELTYNYTSGIISVSMNGQSRTFNALAQQSDIFYKSGFLQSQLFSDFNLTDTGNVSFKYSANILRDLVSYKSKVGALSIEE